MSLDNNPEYSALSYTWGEPTRSAQVTCDGQRLAVTENLFAALKGIRSRFTNDDGTAPFSVWADAICIDQSNKEELGAQVRLMSRIYSQASGVLSWLGADDEGMTGALQLIRQLRELLADVAKTGKRGVAEVVKRTNIAPGAAGVESLRETLYRARLFLADMGGARYRPSQGVSALGGPGDHTLVLAGGSRSRLPLLCGTCHRSIHPFLSASPAGTGQEAIGRQRDAFVAAVVALQIPDVEILRPTGQGVRHPRPV